MASRPIYYGRNCASELTMTEICDFKPNCTICDPILDHKYCDGNIYFPRFRRIENNADVPPSTEPDDDFVGNADSNFAFTSKEQMLASSLQLLELYHTLDFIENYNNGMIVSMKRRR